ncbi:MAG: YicC family protein [Chlamydiae bacterium]|nr:YicC family protein [Chlamydiota bacterium]
MLANSLIFGFFMIKSMTAYGRSSRTTPFGRWNVELHSVNRKFLDITVQLPRDYLMFDIDIRKVISSDIQRGQVTVKVSLVQDGITQETIKRQVEQLKSVKMFFESVAGDLGLDVSKELTLSFLMDQKNIINTSDLDQKEDLIKNDLISVVKEAFMMYMQMKEVEGKALSAEIARILQILKNNLFEIEKLAPQASEQYKKKLLDKIAEVKELDPSDQDKILREVMIYAEKIDISEEVARLNSHFDQFATFLSTKDKSIGRNMDFLLQEMNREINTICSKSDMHELSCIAVRMKGELEKIREQAQNIE